MDKSEAIERLKKAIAEEIPNLRQLEYDNKEYYLWYKNMCSILEASFSKASDEYIEFKQAANFTEFSRNLPIQRGFKQGHYLDNLAKLEIILQSIIQNYEMLGFETKPSPAVEMQPKAFIAHEGETKALDKLKIFLDAMGVTYLIAEIEPSNGRLVEGQVDWSQGQADFTIILATKGKVVNKETGKPQMGTNVADELGRARHVFKNRIILLLETGLEAHTNIGGIVRERFTHQSMDKAFTKIVKELRNWGFMRAFKVEKEQT